MAEIPRRRVCLTGLLELNEERASLGLPPLSPDAWADSLKHGIDSLAAAVLRPGEADSPSNLEGEEMSFYERLKAMLPPSK